MGDPVLAVVHALAQPRVPVFVANHVLAHVLVLGKKKFSKFFNYSVSSLNCYVGAVLAVVRALAHHRVPVFMATHVVDHALVLGKK